MFIYTVQIVWDTAVFSDLKTLFIFHDIFIRYILRYLFGIIIPLYVEWSILLVIYGTQYPLFLSCLILSNLELHNVLFWILKYPNLQYDDSKSLHFCAKLFEVWDNHLLQKKYFLLLLSFINWSFCSYFIFTKRRLFVLKHVRLS